MSKAIADQAKELVKLGLGLQIVKLKPGSKAPAGGQGWQNRVATTPERIARWKGDYNIGIMGGSQRPDGKRLVITDIDVKNGKHGLDSFNRLQADYGNYPRTAEAVTPSNGIHRYLWVPEDVPLVGITHAYERLGYPDIDIIGTGLQAVAAPSVTPTGCYSWLYYPQEGIADAPDWMVDLLRLSARPTAKPAQESETKALPEPEAATLLDSIIERFSIDAPGQRNNRMHRAVCSLVCRGLEPETVTAIMTGWHEHYAPIIGTNLDSALYLLHACIRSCFKAKDQGKLVAGSASTNHLQDSCSLILPPESLQFLSLLAQGFLPVVPHHVSCLPVNKGDRMTLSQRLKGEESHMVESLLRHCLHEQQLHPDRAGVHMTDRQLKGIMEQKFGTRFDDNGTGNSIKLRRLKYRFVSTNKGKAGKFELLERTENGHTGKASVYKITGLAAALPTQVAP